MKAKKTTSEGAAAKNTWPPNFFMPGKNLWEDMANAELMEQKMDLAIELVSSEYNLAREDVLADMKAKKTTSEGAAAKNTWPPNFFMPGKNLWEDMGNAELQVECCTKFCILSDGGCQRLN
ncbi:hypothetical protein ACLB2K_007850 [Fragaria x ananassa]